MKHRKYTRTMYEFAFTNTDGNTAFTLWFNTRQLSINRVMRLVSDNQDRIFTATNSTEIHADKINGQVIVTAGEYIGKLTGNTNYNKNGYA